MVRVAGFVLALALAVAGTAGAYRLHSDKPRAPRWVMTDLGTLGGSHSRPEALNERGQIVGSSDTRGDVTHAFLWQAGRIKDLGTLGGDESEAYDINRRGEIVGRSEVTTGDSHAFLWRAGELIDLGTLGGANSYASAINASSTVVGASRLDGNATGGAFRWRAGRMIGLGTLGGRSVAWDINDRGQVIGNSDTVKALNHLRTGSGGQGE